MISFFLSWIRKVRHQQEKSVIDNYLPNNQPLTDQDADLNLHFCCKQCGSTQYKPIDKITFMCTYCKSLYTNNRSKFKTFLLPAQSQNIDEVLIPYSQNNAWGIINAFTKEIVIPIEYEKVTKFLALTHYHNHTNNYAMKAKKQGKWGLINIKNEYILPFEYDDIYNTSYGYWNIEMDGKKSLISPDGNQIFNFDYNSFSVVSKHRNWGSEIYIKVEKKFDDTYSRYGIADAQGKWIVPINPQIYGFSTFDAKTGLIKVLGIEHTHIGYVKPNGDLEMF